MSEKTSLRLLAARQPLERFLGAVGDDRLEAEFAEHSGGELGDQRVVLDDEHPAARACAPLARASVGGRAAARRQVEGEGRALARAANSTVDRAADLLGEAEHLAEAEPGSFAEALGGEEGLEHALHHFACSCRCRCRRRVSATCSPLKALGLAVRAPRCAALILSLPPSGIASRALMARFSITFSSWCGSTMVFQRPPATHRFDYLYD